MVQKVPKKVGKNIFLFFFFFLGGGGGGGSVLSSKNAYHYFMHVLRSFCKNC